MPRLASGLAATLFALISFGVPSDAQAATPASNGPIRIGIIQALTGTLAISERPLVQAAELAIHQINASGGIRGHPLEAVVMNDQSNWSLAAQEAQQLISQDHVVSLFGCWTSACRQALLPVLQKNSQLLWYPVEYEGSESSPNVIYTGSTPNQQILPSVSWAIRTFGPRLFLIGSNYVFPVTVNKLIREEATALGATIVGEQYIPLGSSSVTSAIAGIEATKPDIILNTINGSSNENFFYQLENSSAAGIPTLSFSIAEGEIQAMGTQLLQGNYLAWNYFQSLESPANRTFINEFRSETGLQDSVTSDPVDAAYFQVLAFAEAASDASDLNPMSIRNAARLNPEHSWWPGANRYQIAADLEDRANWED